MDDLNVEDIWENNQGPKRRNSGRKGKRGELNLAKLFAARFKQPFSRVPQSGAIGSTRAMSDHVKEAYVGDIVTPQHFRFCLEVKHGYSEINLINVIGHGGNKTLDGFLAQATKDAERIKRQPLLCWKQDRLPWLGFLKAGSLQLAAEIDSLELADQIDKACPVSLGYREWTGVDLVTLLEDFPDTFWFTNPSERNA